MSVMRSHARTSIWELTCETGEDGNGQVEMSALELAALRSALHAEKHEIVVTSQNAGGGLEPLVEKGEKAEYKTDFAAQRAEKEKRIRSAYAESLERVRYPRKWREADPAHTIARKVGHSVKPGELPWAHPSGKPAPWSTIQIDQDFINNGPAPHELPETALLTQSRPYFVSVDPMCATIRSVHPRPQNYELSRLFDGWYHEPHNLLPSRTNSSKADSRPQTGYSSKSAKTLRTPLTPEQNIFVQSAGCGPSRLNSRLYQNIPIGNPAAFKLKDFENIWAVDSELLVSDRQTSFGAHTYRDYRPNRLRLHSPGTDRSLASQDSNPVTKVHGSRRLDPLSPVIREIVLAMPRAKARGRDDIPLIASPLGSRGPVSHGSFVPAAARTVNSMDNLYCATQNNSRGTKYIGDTLQSSSIPFVSSSSPQNKDGTWNEFKESDAGPTGEGNVIPFVNLNTYDESFSSPQRLTPMSRKALQRAGFETGEKTGGDLSGTSRSPLRTPRSLLKYKKRNKSRFPSYFCFVNTIFSFDSFLGFIKWSSHKNGPGTGTSMLQVENNHLNKPSRGVAPYEHEPARAELLKQMCHDRQRIEWESRPLTRERMLKEPGKVHGEKMLVCDRRTGTIEEFEWDDEKTKWIRRFPERPQIESNQFKQDKPKSQVTRNSESPTLRLPTATALARIHFASVTRLPTGYHETPYHETTAPLYIRHEFPADA